VAYIVETINYAAPSNTSSFSPLWVTENQETGDFVLMVILSDDANQNAPISVNNGWVEWNGPAPSSSGARCGIWYLEHTGTDIAAPTITGRNDSWAVCTLLIRDADTSNFIDSGSRFLQTANTNNFTIPDLTTLTDGCLVLRVLALDGNSRSTPTTGYGVTIDQAKVTTDGSIELIVGSELKPLAGSVGSFEYENADGSNGGVLITLAITNKSGGYLQYDVKGAPVVIRDFISQQSYNDISAIRTTLNGINTVALLNITDTDVRTYAADTSWYGGYQRVDYSPTNSANSVQGYYKDINSIDLTDKAWSFTAQYTSSSFLADEGSYFYFEDSSGNWVVWQPFTEVRLGNSLFRTITAFLPDETFIDSSGIIDWSDIVRTGHAYEYVGGTSGTRRLYASLECGVQPVVLLGGSPTHPSTYRSITKALKSGQSFYRVQDNGLGQNLFTSPIRIGDGSTETHFSAANSLAEYPEYDTDNQIGYRIKAGRQDIVVNASANCSMDFSASILRSFDLHAFQIASASSPSATYIFDGFSCLGFTVNWSPNVPCSKAAFTSCGVVDLKSAVFDNCNFTKSVSTTHCAVAEDGAEITSCSFIKGDETYALSLGAGSYTLESTTFTGYTTDINVTATTGTVNITLASGQAEPSFITAGATVNFIQPTTTLTLSGLQNSTEIRVFTAGTQTEITGEEVVSTGIFTTSLPVGTTSIDVSILSLGYKNQRLTALDASQNINIPISQELDRQYQNL